MDDATATTIGQNVARRLATPTYSQAAAAIRQVRDEQLAHCYLAESSAWLLRPSDHAAHEYNRRKTEYHLRLPTNIEAKSHRDA